MKRTPLDHARARKNRQPRNRLPRIELLEQRLVFDAAPANELPETSPIELRQIQSEDELQQVLLDNATSKWESLFGTEIRNVEPWNEFIDPAAVLRDTDLAALVRGGENVLAQTDGEYLFIVSDVNKLTVLDVRDPHDIKAVARVGLEGDVREIYVSGDRLVSISGVTNRVSEGVSTDLLIPYWDQRQTVTVYDISNRAEPQPVSRSILNGNIVDSRVDDDSVILVMSSAIHLQRPVVNCAFPDGNEDPATNKPTGSVNTDGGFANVSDLRLVQVCRYESEESYVARISETIVADTLPFALTEFEEGETTRRYLVQPEDIYLDGESLNQLVSTVSFDLDTGVTDSAGILTGHVGQAYFSDEHVYLAIPQSAEAGSEASNSIHEFTIADGDVSLTASARVAGRVINPFAMNEFEGHLRVATSQGRGDESSQNVFVFDADSLNLVGSLTGIGEGLYLGGVHFVEDQAFLSFFANSDDDLSIDLSDPEHPVLGASLDLSVPSNSLFSVDGGYLIDVGRDLDPTNGIERAPTVSLLNVQDLESPELVDREKVGFEGPNWAAALAGRDAVQYFADLGVLAVSFSGFERLAIVDYIPENIGPRLIDSLNLGSILPRLNLADLAKNLPDDLKDLIQRLSGEIPSPEQLRKFIDELPPDIRELLEKGIDHLTPELRAKAVRLLTEAAGRLHRDVKSGLALFTVDPSADPLQRSGTITHDKSIRHTLVIGDVLFAISGDTVTAHDIQHPEQTLDKYYFGQIAYNDTRRVEVKNASAVLNVLENDRVGDSAKIVRVGKPTLGGTATISENGRSIIYTPPTEIYDARGAAGGVDEPNNYDVFEYTVALDDGTRGTAEVTVNLVHEESQAKMVRLAVADLAKRLNIAPEKIEVARVEPQNWPNGCLGIRLPETTCTMAIVPGFVVLLTAQGQRYEYHTDSEKRVALVERPQDPKPGGVEADEFRVVQESGPTKLDVLANDFRGMAFIKAPEITAVSDSKAGGTVKIGEHGRFVLYTPPVNFVGEDHFTYTVDGGPVGNVTVHVVRREPPPEPPRDGDPVIDLGFKITDEAGEAIHTIELGQTFYVNVYVDDLRHDSAAGSKGVFGAYFDLEFDPAFAQVVGEIEYNSTYPNGKSGEVGQGIIDEVGAFADVDPAGETHQLLLRIQFEAIAEGALKFVANPADDHPAHEMLVYGQNEPIPARRVHYGAAELAISNGYYNSNEPTDVNGDTAVTPIDALNVINVINESGAGEVRATMRNYFSREAHAAAKALRMFYDVNRDGFLTAMDPLVVINRLNSDARKAAERQGDDKNLILPPGLGENRSRDGQPFDANGRIRDTANEQNATEIADRPESNTSVESRDGRGEGESVADRLAEVMDDLCSHHQSSRDVDNFFAGLGM